MFEWEFVRITATFTCLQTILIGLKGLFFLALIRIYTPKIEISRL